MKLFDFRAFQNFMEMLSHEKIIFHMLFGAFQNNEGNLPIQKIFSARDVIISKYFRLISKLLQYNDAPRYSRFRGFLKLTDTGRD